MAFTLTTAPLWNHRITYFKTSFMIDEVSPGAWIVVRTIPFVSHALELHRNVPVRDFLRSSVVTPIDQRSISYEILFEVARRHGVHNYSIVGDKGNGRVPLLSFESFLRLSRKGNKFIKSFFLSINLAQEPALRELQTFADQIKPNDEAEDPIIPPKQARKNWRTAALLVRQELGIDLSKTVGSVLGRRGALQELGPEIIAASKKAAITHGLVKESVTLFSEETFPEIWRAMQSRDNAIVPYEALRELSKADFRKDGMVPIQWLQVYTTLVNTSCNNIWMKIKPELNELHPLGSTPGNLGAVMDRHKLVYTDLRSYLKWHIYTAMAEGHDLDPYLFESDGREALTYKFAFDTTPNTGGSEMFMLGIIAHTFPTGRCIQSWTSVFPLCLARAAESSALISGALPGVSAEVEELMKNGLEIPVTHLHKKRFRVEFHIGADMRALWLAFNLKNFVCIYCNSETFSHSNDLSLHHGKRLLTKTLGVPPQNVHLCALHATLRIVERLLKNAVRKCNRHGKPAGNKKCDRTLLEEELKKVLDKSIKFYVDKPEDFIDLEEEGLEVPGPNPAGSNVESSLRNTYVRMTPITGMEAKKIVESEVVYQKIVEISEGKCPMEKLRLEMEQKTACVTGPEPQRKTGSNKSRNQPHTPKQTATLSKPPAYRYASRTKFQLREARGGTATRPGSTCTCDYHLALRVWDDFAARIYPLMKDKEIPDRLCKRRQDPNDRKVPLDPDVMRHVLSQIKREGAEWLIAYQHAYGTTITSYIHVVGTHLHEMLDQKGNSIGEWSQQGFEACHKLIRKVWGGATSHDGGKQKISSLEQILQLMSRRMWARIRAGISTSQDYSRNREMFREYLEDVYFNPIDEKFQEANPQWNALNHVKRKLNSEWHRQSFKKVKHALKESI